MTTFLLVRHAAHPRQGKELTGRRPGVSLGPDGIADAERLAEMLARRPLAAIYSSPMERARETAAPLARRVGLDVAILEALDELDFGAWTGMTFGRVREDPAWAPFNALRSMTAIPGGELMLDAQARVVRTLLDLRARHGDAEVALFSHGDPIKAAVAYALGVPLDLFQRIEISPASITIVELGAQHVRVVAVNRIA